jgi:membrane associated rhomboid family serine protease
MARGADLFIVCKNCGSEVSPYVTECPYCGQRVRKRAPKIERGGGAAGEIREPAAPKPPKARKPRRTRRTTASAGARFERANPVSKLTANERPVATMALIAVAILAYLALFANAYSPLDVIIVGPIDGDWWKPFTAPFVSYGQGSVLGGGGNAVLAGGAYQFATLLTIGIFGWLLERRHGPFVVLAIAIVAGAGGMFVAQEIESIALAAGANGMALGLLCAWAVPDLLAWRRSAPYDGDLLGTAVIAAVLLLMPLMVDTADPYAGVTGAVVGLLVGFPLARVAQRA